MKILLCSIVLCISMNLNAQTFNSDTTLLSAVEVVAVRASEKTPVAKTNLYKQDIEKLNTGQDLPFLLNLTPSVVINSDAGNGFGYTGIRIRGTDAGRINVTINGIPYNDAESQGTFFVDIPDFASSAQSIQIQRGVGTSSNGSSSFGGAINIGTNEINKNSSFEINNTIGSYGSLKNSLLFNSGLINKKFLADVRLSQIRSNGYVDRATSRLQSFYSSLAYVDNKNSLRFNIISGKEKTYQAWNGVDEETLKTNRTFNSSGTEKPGDPYENETDNFLQNHFQLFYNHKISTRWKTGAALFLTTGDGYYEQYNSQKKLSSFFLSPYISGNDTIKKTDAITRLNLKNAFFGLTFSIQYLSANRTVLIGGGANHYDGKHFGNVIESITPNAIPQNYRWYDLTAYKNEQTVYGKWTESLTKNIQSFVDIQLRAVDYKINGFRKTPDVIQDNNYLFLSPKVGLTYTKNNKQAFISFGKAVKEPNREDFESGLNQVPKPEKLYDLEAGLEMKFKKYSWSANLFYMYYRDQLILSGEINDVGAYTRTNVDKSYRTGIELQGSATLNKYLSLNTNFSLSSNKILNFTEFIDDYDNGGQIKNEYAKTTIALSPSSVGMLSLNINPIKNGEINLVGKYVGKQFLDNTGNDARSLNSYYVQDLRLAYKLTKIKNAEFNFFFQINNLFSKNYEPNGYTFSYYADNKLNTENYY
ncbi:MAG: TonB-dependent receptor, partial [Ferruginibacter sp.]